MTKLEAFAHITGIVLTIAITIYIINIITQMYRPIARPFKETIEDRIIYLPMPRKISSISVEEAILWRRSIREYTLDPIKLEHLAMILWAAYGITDTVRGFRASPSAGATYPLELYVLIGEKSVTNDDGKYLRAGIYKYNVYTHTLNIVVEGDLREELYRASLEQECVRKAPLSIIVTAIFERTTRIYGNRGRVRYVPMEVGHLGQNVYLMATALGLGAVVIGAFNDVQVAEIIRASYGEEPMYIIPIGTPKEFYKTSFEEIESYIYSRRG